MNCFDQQTCSVSSDSVSEDSVHGGMDQLVGQIIVAVRKCGKGGVSWQAGSQEKPQRGLDQNTLQWHNKHTTHATPFLNF